MRKNNYNHVSKKNKNSAKTDSIKFDLQDKKYNKLQKEIRKIRKQKELLLVIMAAFDKKQTEIFQNLKKLESKYDSVLNNEAADNLQSMIASLEMQEIQMSFNLQYLQLQSRMQNENRSYTAVSNIMKTKHDTVKNSISNVR